MSPVTLKLKELREARGMSQQQLADAVNVRQATISDLETGKAKTLRLALLDALAIALEVDASDLIHHARKTKRGR